MDAPEVPPAPRPAAARTLAEDLQLLLLDPASGRPLTDATRLDLALAGALVVELALHGRVDVEARRLLGSTLVVGDGAPLGEPLLDTALQQLRAREGQRPAAALNRLKRGLRARVLARLAQRGDVEARTATVWGLVPVRRWPPSPSARHDLHARLAALLTAPPSTAATTGAARTGADAGGGPPQREAALVALLHAVDAVPKLFAATTGLSRRELKQRAGALSEGDWAAAAVRRAVRDVQVATTAAITAATATAAGSS